MFLCESSIAELIIVLSCFTELVRTGHPPSRVFIAFSVVF